MNTKFFMTASAIALGVQGMIFTFLPAEIAGYLEAETTNQFQFLIQIIGALYFGFGMLNWMTKTNPIGGIYNRPVAIANLSHFTIGGLALIKGLLANPALPKAIWIIGIIYVVFAIAFGIVLFHDPLNEKKPE